MVTAGEGGHDRGHTVTGYSGRIPVGHPVDESRLLNQSSIPSVGAQMVHSGKESGNNGGRSPRSRRSRWLPWGIGAGVVTLGVGAGGALWLSHYVREQLAPQVSAQLSQVLQRPVELGAVTQASWYTLEFGESRIPPTATDADQVTLAGLRVGFDPWEIWRGVRSRDGIPQPLTLHITVQDPQVYVEQSAGGAWVDTRLKLPDTPGRWKVQVQTVALEGGSIVLAPRNPQGALGSLVELSDGQGRVSLEPEGTWAGQWESGVGTGGATLGQVQVTGEVGDQGRSALVEIQGDDLPVPLLLGLAANPLDLPGTVLGGTAQTQMKVTLDGNQGVQIKGEMQFKNLVAQDFGSQDSGSEDSGSQNLGFGSLGGDRVALNPEPSNPQQSNLEPVNLQQSNLEQSNLQQLSLEQADLQQVNFQQADLQQANFQQANFQPANLQQANFQPVNLQQSNLEQFSPQELSLEQAGLEQANLHQLNFQQLDFQQGAFHFGTIAQGSGQPRGDCPYQIGQWAKVKCSLLQPANRQQTSLQPVNLEQASVQPANLQQTNLAQSNLQANPQQAKPEQSNLQQLIGTLDIGKLNLGQLTSEFDLNLSLGANPTTDQTENVDPVANPSNSSDLPGSSPGTIGGLQSLKGKVNLKLQNFDVQGESCDRDLNSPDRAPEDSPSNNPESSCGQISLKTLEAKGEGQWEKTAQSSVTNPGESTGQNTGQNTGANSPEPEANNPWQSLKGTIVAQDLQTQNLPRFLALLLPNPLPPSLAPLQAPGMDLTLPRLQLKIQPGTIALAPLDITLGDWSTQLAGSVNWQDKTWDLRASLGSFSLAPTLAWWGITSPVPLAGTVTGDIGLGGTWSQPQIQGSLASVGPMQVDRLRLDPISTRFRVENLPLALGSVGDRPPTLQLTETRFNPTVGGTVRGNGRVILSANPTLDLEFSAENLPLEPLAQAYDRSLPIAVGTVAAQGEISGPLGNPETRLRFQALEATYPTQGQLRLDRETITVENAVVSVAGGSIRVQGRQRGDRWLARLNASQLQPSLLDLPLRGLLNGAVNLTGPRNTFNFAQMRGQGDLTLSQGVSLIQTPLQANLVWDGQDLQVRQARAQNFEGQGTLAVALPDATGLRSPQITGLDLNVQLTDYPLTQLPLGLPPQVDMQGKARFQGRIQGNPAAPRLQGQVQLADFTINRTPFETLLTGTLDRDDRGLTLALQGQQDTLQLNLDSANRPQFALLRRNQGTVEARRQGDLFQVDIAQFPLSTLGFSAPLPQLGSQVVAGLASGSLNLSLQPFNVAGAITVDRPNWGHLTADYAQSQFRWSTTGLDIVNGSLGLKSSTVNFTGRAVLGANPQFKLDLAIPQAQVADVLTTLQWFDLVDVQRGLALPTYDTAAEVGSASLGEEGAALGRQLQRFSEIKAQVTQNLRQRQEARRIPPLRELTGTLGGTIALAGSPQNGLQADFNLGGNQWVWGDYHLDRVTLDGEFANNQLTLQPVLVQAKGMEARFAGTVGGAQQSGQLTISQLPMDFVRQFIDLPVDVQGRLDLQATVGGSVADPQLLGSLNLVSGTLNQVPLVTQDTGFSYVDGRLGFGSTLAVNNNTTDPVTLQGEIPYNLPFSTVKASDNTLNISLNVKNEGLALLNLLTQNNLTWIDGQGNIALRVGGTVAEPVAEGLVTLEGAQMTAKALPEGETLTDLRGKIRFVRDRLEVQNLTGLFSQGQVNAAGILPLAAPLPTDDPDRANPLMVSFQNLNLSLPGLYRGGAGGTVQVVGSLLNPRVTGNLALNNGEIIIPDPATAALRRLATLRQGEAPTPPLSISPITFDNLNLQLADNVNVVSQPLFSFRAEGGLLINGDLGDLRPDGRINITRGQVNLFTTNFTLVRRRENVAVFRPENGLDPDLDVQLMASVTEVSNQLPSAGPLPQSEILDSPLAGFNELQTIRIRADVEGPASNLLQNLKLSSRPARTQSELYAMMGGGFINTLGQGGDSTLALANLAGSALLNNVQTAINNALSGPVDFRLFPTIVDSDRLREQADNDKPESNASTLALGAELGVNLTNSLSFSVLRLLTLDLPTRFNLRYQVGDHWQMRGTTDFQGDNRLVVEYEARF